MPKSKRFLSCIIRWRKQSIFKGVDVIKNSKTLKSWFESILGKVTLYRYYITLEKVKDILTDSKATIAHIIHIYWHSDVIVVFSLYKGEGRTYDTESQP